MEREHLIIIALILVALYMMNKDDSKDTVQGIAPAPGPLGRIRYNTDCDPLGAPGSNPCAPPIGSHIRTRREGFMPANDQAQEFDLSSYGGSHIRLSDKYIGGSQHIKNHIRSRNTNSSFNGMMSGEPFRFTDCDPSKPGMPC